MKYDIWPIGSETIQQCKLNEDTFRVAIKDLVEKMKDSPLHCSGMLLAAKVKGGDWRYLGEKYFGEELPSLMDRISTKESGLIAYVVATVKEADNGTDELG